MCYKYLKVIQLGVEMSPLGGDMSRIVFGMHISKIKYLISKMSTSKSKLMSDDYFQN